MPSSLSPFVIMMCLLTFLLFGRKTYIILYNKTNTLASHTENLMVMINMKENIENTKKNDNKSSVGKEQHEHVVE